LRKVRVCEGAAHESSSQGDSERIGKEAGSSGCIAESQHERYRMYLILIAKSREREMGTVPTVLAVLLTHSIRYRVYPLSSWEKFMFLAI
jgi:hypothetical protein